MGFKQGKAALAALCVSLAAAALHGAPECQLKEGGKLAIIGDSITEQRGYSNYIETYLTACHPELKQNVCQFGWGGERSISFARRMDHDLLSWFKPDAATVCFGMNDGQYTKLTPAIANDFEKPTKEILEKLKAAGANAVAGGPGAVDPKTYWAGREKAEAYNDGNLAELSAIAERVAPECGAKFAPLHKTLMDAMRKAKAARGDGFIVCGGDGIHPGANGHLVMAYVFLKGLGVDGDVASIKLDMKDSKAQVSEGQKALSFKEGVLELESSRYPFCFGGMPKTTSGFASSFADLLFTREEPFAPGTQNDAATMLDCIPFNQDLNRFTLTVSNLPWDKAKVSWGSEAKTFTKAELEKGVNLAAEFLNNPLKEQFMLVETAVADKQLYETILVKSFIVGLRSGQFSNPADQETVKSFLEVATAKREELRRRVEERMIPVKSELKIEKAGQGEAK